MADYIADYTSLSSEVRTWLARNDSTFTARFPVFVSLAESRIYNGAGKPGDPLYSAPVRATIMENNIATVTLTGGIGTLPSDVLQVRKLYRPTDSEGLSYAPPARWEELNADADPSSNPYYYTIEGSTLKVTPSYDGTLNLLYFQQFPAVGPSNTAGPMIQEYGLLYFKAVMFYACGFLKDTDSAGNWLSEYRAAVDGINRVSSEIRMGAQRFRSIAKVMGC